MARKIHQSVSLLLVAGMSAFVVVEISDPRSTPLELQAIAATYGVPIVPILAAGAKPFGMFQGLGKFEWVLSPLQYRSTKELIGGLKTASRLPGICCSTRRPSRSVMNASRKRPDSERGRSIDTFRLART